MSFYNVMIIPGNRYFGSEGERGIFQQLLPLDEPPNGQEHHHEGDLWRGAETAGDPDYPGMGRTGTPPEAGPYIKQKNRPSFGK